MQADKLVDGGGSGSVVVGEGGLIFIMENILVVNDCLTRKA